MSVLVKPLGIKLEPGSPVKKRADISRVSDRGSPATRCSSLTLLEKANWL